MNNILKNLFTNKKATEIKDNSIIKIVVVDFVCHNNIYANTLFDALNNTNFKATLFTEKFNKHFLNLNKRTFFDLIDYGNTILNKEQADVLIWGYQEGDNIRINFHTKHSFANWDNLSFGILESVDIPTKYLKSFPNMIRFC